MVYTSVPPFQIPCRRQVTEPPVTLRSSDCFSCFLLWSASIGRSPFESTFLSLSETLLWSSKFLEIHLLSLGQEITLLSPSRASSTSLPLLDYSYRHKNWLSWPHISTIFLFSSLSFLLKVSHSDSGPYHSIKTVCDEGQLHLKWLLTPWNGCFIWLLKDKLFLLLLLSHQLYLFNLPCWHVLLPLTSKH